MSGCRELSTPSLAANAISHCLRKVHADNVSKLNISRAEQGLPPIPAFKDGYFYGNQTCARNWGSQILSQPVHRPTVDPKGGVTPTKEKPEALTTGSSREVLALEDAPPNNALAAAPAPSQVRCV